MILGTNFETTIIGPFATIFGWVMAGFYSFTHSYGLSIILLTLVTMLVVFPLTQKGTRGMIQMQLLQPELMALRNKHKKRPGMTSQEKLEVNRAQQEEMMALYKERGASPTGGCLPLVLQFPIFIVLYNVIRGMTDTISKTIGTGKAAHIISKPSPLYINIHTQLYQSLVKSNGVAKFLGFDLTDSLRTHPGVSGFGLAPFVIVILLAVGLQYVSIWQITARQANSGMPQQQQMVKFQRIMPLFFLFIYYAFPAGVGIYFIVSSLFRICQQGAIYKWDPVITKSMAELSEQRRNNPQPAGSKKGFRERMAELSGQSVEPAGKPTRSTSRTSGVAKQGSGRPAGATKAAGTKAGATKAAGTKAGGTKAGGTKAAGTTKAGATKAAGASKAGGTRPRAAGTEAGTAPKKAGSGARPAGAKSSGTRPAGVKAGATKRSSNGVAASKPAAGPRRPTSQPNGNGSNGDGAATSNGDGSDGPRRQRRPQ